MKAVATVFVGLLSVAIASTAPAEKKPSELDVRKTVRRYATCFVEKLPDAARLFVLRKLNAGLVRGDCVKSEGPGDIQLRFIGDTYRYALAEALLPIDFASGIPAGIAMVPPLDQGPRPVAIAELPPEVRRSKARMALNAQAQIVWSLAAIGECVARAAPAPSYALATSVDGSPEEGAAFAQLRPVIALCLPPGLTATFKRATTRGAVAHNLYRLAHAARPLVLHRSAPRRGHREVVHG